MRTRLYCLAVAIVAFAIPGGSRAQASSKERLAPSPVLWRQVKNIRSRDLRFGPGSAKLAPSPPFRFIKEVKSGESPKFKVEDANRVVWTVKLGPEAQAETVAVRLVWAVGYFAEEAYYLRRVRIRNLPRLSRGREFVNEQGLVEGARFEPERKNVVEGETWDWSKNPFVETRELNGLKVLMILLNNYDAREENNRILTIKEPDRGRFESRYVVTDLGASLGRAGGFGDTRSKNNLEDFLSTGFVLGVKDGVVKFDYDTRPTKLGTIAILYPPYYNGEVRKEKSMRGIPVADAQWVGLLLAQLTDEQLRDAFRAAAYDSRTMGGYVLALRQRINQLKHLHQ